LKKLLNNSYGYEFKSFGLAILVHIILLLIFQLANIDDIPTREEDVIFLQLMDIPVTKKSGKILKKENNEENLINDKLLTKSKKEEEAISVKESPQSFNGHNNNENFQIPYDSATVLNSFIEQNPNIVALKTALVQKLKNVKIAETDSAAIAKNMRKIFLAYYKMKYPTPLSKFGRSPLPGISRPDMLNFSIPIDDIINLFK